MNKKTNSMATIGVTNVTTMAISKGVAFVGAVLILIGVGGIGLSNKYFTETEMNYIFDHVSTK